MQSAFMEKVLKSMGRTGSIGRPEGMLGGAAQWLRQQLDSINHDLERARNKELTRLLSMFDSDPEEALRHAIPMNDSQHRGIAPPGSRLGSRAPDFNLARISGGGAADFWAIPAQMRLALQRRYREMADRELQLKRFRRAAYIYAELLGDLSSAANALKQGKHFREAAILYDERLQNPIEAAKCFGEAGLVDEARLEQALAVPTRMVLIQRSCGYSWRPSLSVPAIGRLVERVKALRPDCLEIGRAHV